MNGTPNRHDDEARQPSPAASQAPPPGGYAPGYYPPAAGMPAAQPAPLRDPRSKSVILACVLSLLPGLGQIYVGYYVRGFVHAIVVGGVISLLNELDRAGAETLMPLLGIFLAFFWLYNVIDAGRKAALYNFALAGGSPLDLPSDFVMPKTQGSIGLGAIVILGSFVLLLNTLFGVPLDWLRYWWPVLPMGFGAYLIVRAIQERSAGKSE